MYSFNRRLNFWLDLTRTGPPPLCAQRPLLLETEGPLDLTARLHIQALQCHLGPRLIRGRRPGGEIIHRYWQNCKVRSKSDLVVVAAAVVSRGVEEAAAFEAVGAGDVVHVADVHPEAVGIVRLA